MLASSTDDIVKLWRLGFDRFNIYSKMATNYDLSKLK